jgi:hypothetical protein
VDQGLQGGPATVRNQTGMISHRVTVIPMTTTGDLTGLFAPIPFLVFAGQMDFEPTTLDRNVMLNELKFLGRDAGPWRFPGFSIFRPK